MTNRLRTWLILIFLSATPLPRISEACLELVIFLPPLFDAGTKRHAATSPELADSDFKIKYLICI